MFIILLGFPSSWAVNNLPAMQKPQELQVPSLDLEESLEEGVATHSNILAWRIPWTEEPGKLQSTESPRVGQDGSILVRMHSFYFFPLLIWNLSYPFHVISAYSPFACSLHWAYICYKYLELLCYLVSFPPKIHNISTKMLYVTRNSSSPSEMGAGNTFSFHFYFSTQFA